jgi:hypothetical protein
MLTCAVLTVLVVLSAQALKSAPDFASDVLSKLDVNKDGQVEKKEFLSRFNAILADLKKNQKTFNEQQQLSMTSSCAIS